MVIQSIKNACVLKTSPFKPQSKLLIIEDIANDAGLMQKVSHFKSVDFTEIYSFKSSDFSIASLMSVGALGKLQTTFVNDMHNMNVADKFENYKIEANV